VWPQLWIIAVFVIGLFLHLFANSFAILILFFSFLYQQSGTKGDMRVTFKITFPDLTETERTQIGNIIKNCPYKQARK